MLRQAATEAGRVGAPCALCVPMLASYAAATGNRRTACARWASHAKPIQMHAAGSGAGIQCSGARATTRARPERRNHAGGAPRAAVGWLLRRPESEHSALWSVDGLARRGGFAVPLLHLTGGGATEAGDEPSQPVLLPPAALCPPTDRVVGGAGPESHLPSRAVVVRSARNDF